MNQNMEQFEQRTLFSGGQLDAFWGSGGEVRSTLSDPGVVLAIAPETDGKILAAGTVQGHIFFSRFMHDGSLDTTFGDGSTLPRGYILTNLLPQRHSQLTILDNGFFYFFANDYMARFTRDGIADSRFGNSGVVSSLAVRPDQAIVEPEGAIVLGGHRHANAAVARYRANGLRDTGFGNHGVVQLPMPSPAADAFGVHEQSDGKIVLGTRYSHHLYDVNNSEDERWTLNTVRLNHDGSYDSTYGTDGISSNFEIQLFAQFSTIQNNHALFYPDGSVLITWQTDSALDLCKFNAVGQTDGAWNPSAFKSNALLGEDSNNAFVQSDGKIIVVGPNKIGRLLQSGATDTAFGANGMNTTSVFGDQVTSVTSTIGNDGAIYIGGRVNGDQFIVARYWRENAPAVQMFADDLIRPTPHSYKFRVAIRDDLAVDATSITADAFRVVGPDGRAYRVKIASITPDKNASVINVQLKLAGPDGAWDSADSGFYEVRLLPAVLSDLAGNKTAGRTIGAFRSRI